MYIDIYFWSGGDQAMHQTNTIAVVMVFDLDFVCNLSLTKHHKATQKHYNVDAIMLARPSANTTNLKSLRLRKLLD